MVVELEKNGEGMSLRRLLWNSKDEGEKGRDGTKGQVYIKRWCLQVSLGRQKQLLSGILRAYTIAMCYT